MAHCSLVDGYKLEGRGFPRGNLNHVPVTSIVRSLPVTILAVWGPAEEISDTGLYVPVELISIRPDPLGAR